MAFFEKVKKLFHMDDTDDFVDDMGYENEVDVEQERDNLIKPGFNTKFREPYTEEEVTYRNNDNFKDLRKYNQTNTNKRTYNAEVKIYNIEKFEDSKVISDEIRSRRAVIINISRVDTKTAQRLLDFVSGSTYALDGEITEIMDKVYVLTPNNIKISEEMNATNIKSVFNFK